MAAADSPMSDSGYNSLSPNPTIVPSDSSCQQLQEIQGFTRFERDVDKSTELYFEDIVLRLKAPLLAELRKSGKNFHPMAIRLAVLGKDEQSAKPCIVVFCPKRVCKIVNKFLKKDFVVRLCQPNQPGLPNLDVYVDGRAPQPKATGPLSSTNIELDSSFSADESNWATRIRVDGTEESQFATLGGLVVVIDKDGALKAYGLTAGHTLIQKAIDQDDESDISDDEDLAGSTYGSEIMIDKEDTSKAVEQPESSIDVSYAYTKDSGEEIGWSRLGHVAAASFSEPARNRDWALIEDMEEYIQANHSRKNITERYFLDERKDGVAGRNETIEIRYQPLFYGSISRLPSFALLPFSTDFVRVHTITFSDGYRLPAGSSGSWVLTKTIEWPGDNRLDWPQDASQRNPEDAIERTVRVLGHIVADDILGDAYVVPLTDILNDIRGVLNTREVRLPESNSEIASIMHTKSADTGIATPKPIEKLDDEAVRLETQQVMFPPFRASSGHTDGSRGQHEQAARTGQENPDRRQIKRPVSGFYSSFGSGGSGGGSGGGGGGKPILYRWKCCYCLGDNSCEFNPECIHCNNHRRSSCCKVYTDYH